MCSSDLESAVVPGGQKYSPPIIHYAGRSGAWSADPSVMWFCSVLHEEPVKLPHKVEERKDALGNLRWIDWVAPMVGPGQAMTPHALSDLAEIVF